MKTIAEPILGVDRNEHDLVLVKHALQECDLENPLFTVRSGEEAINYLLGAGQFAYCPHYPLPSVVILELNLPGMSGLELLRWIRCQPHLSSLFVVVLTGWSKPGVLNEARNSGADRVFVKPGDWLKLRHVAAALKPYLWTPSGDALKAQRELVTTGVAIVR